MKREDLADYIRAHQLEIGDVWFMRTPGAASNDQLQQIEDWALEEIEDEVAADQAFDEAADLPDVAGTVYDQQEYSAGPAGLFWQVRSILDRIATAAATAARPSTS